MAPEVIALAKQLRTLYTLLSSPVCGIGFTTAESKLEFQGLNTRKLGSCICPNPLGGQVSVNWVCTLKPFRYQVHLPHPITQSLCSPTCTWPVGPVGRGLCASVFQDLFWKVRRLLSSPLLVRTNWNSHANLLNNTENIACCECREEGRWAWWWRRLPTSVMIHTLRSVHSQIRREKNAMDRTA